MHIEESAFHSLNRANQGHAPTHPPDSETFLPCYTFLGITQPRTSFWGDGALRSKYCTFTFLPRQCETMFHNPTVRLISTRSSMPISSKPSWTFRPSTCSYIYSTRLALKFKGQTSPFMKSCYQWRRETLETHWKSYALNWEQEWQWLQPSRKDTWKALLGWRQVWFDWVLISSCAFRWPKDCQWSIWGIGFTCLVNRVRVESCPHLR